MPALPPSMTKARSSQWDMGPDTAAQKAGRIIEPADYVDEETGEKVNPNGVRRARRIDLVESYHKRDRNPILDKRQFMAATSLREAYLQTQRTAPAIKKVQVDSSPKPDAHVEIMIDRLSKFSGLMKCVPTEAKSVVDIVVLENQAVGSLREYRGSGHAKGVIRLQGALNLIADQLGY